jgi:hypothetical protein
VIEFDQSKFDIVKVRSIDHDMIIGSIEDPIDSNVLLRWIEHQIDHSALVRSIVIEFD